MSILSRISRRIGLDRAPVLKLWSKQLLWLARDPLRRGIPLELGGQSVRVPVRFAGPPWIGYEPAATRRAAAWFNGHADCVAIDVGSSVALYSLLALACAPQAEAWAIDADRISLQASRWLCRHSGSERLHVIHGYVGEQPTLDQSAPDVARITAAMLVRDRVPSEPGLASYRCIDRQSETGIPVLALDRLFVHAQASRPHFVKIDVEGAEGLVLRGADQFIRRVRPQLLVSVHPPALRGYGQRPEDVGAWLRERGYGIEIEIEPHEEHWWCTPTDS